MRYPVYTSGRAPRRRGIALIAVLIVVAILALAAYRFTDLMAAEQQAADSYTRQQQARLAADSGVQYAAAVLAAWNSQTNYYDNPSLFQGIMVQDGDAARQRGRFSILSPVVPDSGSGGSVNSSFLFGVTDEGGKINVNALMKLDSSGTILYNVLMQLPNMTDAIANSIVYWVDPKAQARSSGATDETYMSLDPPYHAKNGPLDSTEELLFVQGVTPQLLFGNDRNRNGVLDPDEDDGSGALDMGWSAYLTAYSRETNVDSAGNPRIYLNDPDLQSLQTYLTNAGFDDSMTTFILAARMYGVTSPNSGGSGNGSPTNGSGGTTGTNGAAGANGANGAAGAKTSTTTTQTGVTTSVVTTSQSGTAASGTGSATTTTKSAGNGGLQRSSIGSLQSASGSQNISSLYSLIGGQVTVPSSDGSGSSTTYVSPMSDTGSIRQYLPMVLDKLTTKKTGNLPGRINVNTASSTVLSALAPNGTPLLDVSTVQSIMGTRPSTTATDAPDAIFATPTWLITEASLPVATVQSLDQYITARSQVFRVQSVGHFDAAGPTARVEAVIDTNAGRPRIVYYRDLTGLGKGFNLQGQQQ